MKNKHNIKRGVNLCSFMEEYYLRRITLEEILEACSKMGTSGIEIIGDQMIPRYPHISDEFIKQWRGWMDKYELTPVGLDVFLDWNKFKGRDMTEDERYESVLMDIKNANKLECTILRVVHVGPALLERLEPEARKHNVVLAYEIQAPSYFDSPKEQRLIELFQRLQSPFLGFTLDLGVYTKRLPRVASERLQREGMKEEIIEYLVNGYNNRTLPTINELGEFNVELKEKVLEMGGRDKDIKWALMATRGIFADTKTFPDYASYTRHIHGKFWEMLPDFTAYSVPYKEIIPFLIQGGYEGYINSEYDGSTWLQDSFTVNSTLQVKRQQIMLKNILGEA